MPELILNDNGDFNIFPWKYDDKDEKYNIFYVTIPEKINGINTLTVDIQMAIKHENVKRTRHYKPYIKGTDDCMVNIIYRIPLNDFKKIGCYTIWLDVNGGITYRISKTQNIFYGQNEYYI